MDIKGKNINVLAFLFLAVAGTLMFSLVSSCGKTGTLPATSNIQYQVLNLSTDVQPVDLYISTKKVNATPFRYPNSSGYFTLTAIDTPFQIRSAQTTVSTVNLLSINKELSFNIKYSLFITGFKLNKTLDYIFTTDTASNPTAGRGKVRFVNATAGANVFNITANGTTVFANQKYKDVSKYVDMPAGDYNFKLYSTTSATTILSELPNVNVQDGKIYTLYCRGIVGRVDTAAFGMAIFKIR
jgi:hypothetical protein